LRQTAEIRSSAARSAIQLHEPVNRSPPDLMIAAFLRGPKDEHSFVSLD
jgi:hypothetical protein